MDGTEIENPYTEFGEVDPTEVKAGDGTGIGSEVGSVYGNRINEMHEYITQNPTEKYEILGGAMKDPKLSDYEKDELLMHTASPTEIGVHYNEIFTISHPVSLGQFDIDIYDPMSKIITVPEEGVNDFKAFLARNDVYNDKYCVQGMAVVKDDVLYTRDKNLLWNIIDAAQKDICEYSETNNKEAAWFLARKKVLWGNKLVPLENFIFNYRELTPERKEIIKQYNEKMGIENVVEKHGSEIKKEMKNYGFWDRLFNGNELKEQIVKEKYKEEAKYHVKTCADVDRLLGKLVDNGYADIVTALEYEALRQRKKIGELFGAESLDDDAGVYMASGSPESLEFRQETDNNGIVHMIPNMPISEEHKKYLESQGYIIDYKDAEKTVKRKARKKNRKGKNPREYLARAAEKYDALKNTITDVYKEMRSSEGRTKGQMLRDGGVNAGVKLVDLMGDGGDEIKRMMENVDVYGSAAEIFEVLRYYLHYDEERSDSGETKGEMARDIGAEGAGSLGMYFQKHKEGIKKNLHKLGVIAFGALAVAGGIAFVVYDSEDGLKKGIFRETNEERGYGKQFAWNDNLARAAQGHAEDMAVRGILAHNFSEEISGEEELMGRFRSAGYEGYGAENILQNNYELTDEEMAEFVVERWMNSDGHRENLLNPNYSEIGVGVARGEGNMVYYVQNFGG